jgi:hypothetical protein
MTDDVIRRVRELERRLDIFTTAFDRFTAAARAAVPRDQLKRKYDVAESARRAMASQLAELTASSTLLLELASHPDEIDYAKAILQRAEIAMTSIAQRSSLELHRYLGMQVL